MSDDGKPTIVLRFEDGPYDGLTIAWPGDAAGCPTAFTFEHHRFDRAVEADMGYKEAFRVVAEAKYLGARSHRYEIGGMVCPLDGAEQWTYGHMGGGPVAHHEDDR
jgi:hypothetical protein